MTLWVTKIVCCIDCNVFLCDVAWSEGSFWHRWSSGSYWASRTPRSQRRRRPLGRPGGKGTKWSQRRARWTCAYEQLLWARSADLYFSQDFYNGFGLNADWLGFHSRIMFVQLAGSRANGRTDTTTVSRCGHCSDLPVCCVNTDQMCTGMSDQQSHPHWAPWSHRALWRSRQTCELRHVSEDLIQTPNLYLFQHFVSFRVNQAKQAPKEKEALRASKD